MKTQIKPKIDYLLTASDLGKYNEFLALAPIRVTGLVVTIESDEPPNPVVVRRIEGYIQDYVDRYAQEIKSSLDMAVEAIKANPEKAESFATKYDKLVASNLIVAQKGLQSDVEAMIRKWARDDQNLLEARIAITGKFVFKGISLAKNVTTLIVSHGVHIKKWYDIASDIYDLALLIQTALADEAKRLEILRTKIRDFEQKTQEVQQAKDDAAKAKGIAATVVAWMAAQSAESSAQSAMKEAETARKNYRNSVTKSRQKLEALGPPITELQKELKNAKGLTEGVKLGASLMTLKRQVSAGIKEMDQKEQQVDQIFKYCQQIGVQVSDATWMQKLKAFDLNFMKESLSTAKDIKDAAEGVKTIVENLAKLV